MKKILHILCFLPLFAFGQDIATYTFRLDTFGIDSFFLVEVTTIPQSGLPRAIETEYPIYMTDTAQLSAYILSMDAEYGALVAQAADLSKRKEAWAYRHARVMCLRDSVFYGRSCGTGLGSRMVTMPNSATLDTMTHSVYELNISPEPPGFWVVYPSGGFDWVTGIEQAKQSGVILYRNGITAKFTKPKQPVKKPRKK